MIATLEPHIGGAYGTAKLRPVIAILGVFSVASSAWLIAVDGSNAIAWLNLAMGSC